jgi:uncharacterized membrane protein YfcA
MKRMAGAFGCGAAIATLGGLIGLGGAEFRLPALSGWFGFSIRQAVPLNLLVSLLTVGAALLTRIALTGLPALTRFLPEIAAMATGGIVGACLATGLFMRIKDDVLERVVGLLLLGIAAILFAEAIVPHPSDSALIDSPSSRILVGLVVGGAIGMVSSLLGVAGGELIIPMMLLLFGADIRTAGTASLAISLPMVAIGVARYMRAGALSDRGAARDVAAPMAVGSIVVAALGALLVGIAPDSAIKLMLGAILAISALRILKRSGSPPNATAR